MSHINNAFEVDSLLINEKIELLAGDVDPSLSAGTTATVGSLYLRSDGKIYNKVGLNDNEWQLNDAGTGSASNTDEYSGSILTAINYTAADKVLIFVDSTNQNVVVLLPNASDFTNKIFNIKWIAGKYKCSVKAQPSETIDDNNCQVFGEVMDSLQIVSYGGNWYII